MVFEDEPITGLGPSAGAPDAGMPSSSHPSKDFQPYAAVSLKPENPDAHAGFDGMRAFSDAVYLPIHVQQGN